MARELDTPVYMQMVAFNEQGKVVWVRSIPSQVADDGVDKAIHTFLASRSVSNALFEGVSAKPEPDGETQLYLNRKRIRTSSPAQAVAVVCDKPDRFIAGYPFEDTLWLGLFARTVPVMEAVEICSLLARIALAIDLLAPINESLVNRLNYFYEILYQHYNLQEGQEQQKFIESMKYLQSLSPNTSGTSVWPRPLSNLPSLAKNSLPYKDSLLAALRPPAPNPSPRRAWWAVAACALSKGGHVLKAEGLTIEHAEVLAWRYHGFDASSISLGHHEYADKLLLRSWYALGPLCLVVLSSQAELTQTPPVKSIELNQLHKRALTVLVDVKAHFEFARS